VKYCSVYIFCEGTAVEGPYYEQRTRVDARACAVKPFQWITSLHPVRHPIYCRQGKVTVISMRTEPYNNLQRKYVDVSHAAYLVASLIYIILIDTNSVDLDLEALLYTLAHSELL
jgi:hypothetical protein